MGVVRLTGGRNVSSCKYFSRFTITLTFLCTFDWQRAPSRALRLAHIVSRWVMPTTLVLRDAFDVVIELSQRHLSHPSFLIDDVKLNIGIKRARLRKQNKRKLDDVGSVVEPVLHTATLSTRSTGASIDSITFVHQGR